MNRAALAFFCAFFFLPHLAAAQVVISEVMYDLEGSDTDREWVEVFNSGSSAILLTEWKLFEANSNHGIVAHSDGESLASGAYAVIADNPLKFLEDRPGYTEMLFDSAFSLSNTGEALTLRCCGTGESLIDKDSVSYAPETGAAGDSNTLHRTSVGGSSFNAGAATPGTGTLQKTANAGSSGGEQEEDTVSAASGIDSSTSGSTSSGSANLSRTSAGANRIVIAGVDSRFEANAFDGANRSVEAEFRWNFGDGTTALGRSVLHKWEYEGRYAVVLEAVRFGEKATHRVIVTVEEPELSFETLSDGGIVIENLSNRELDLSGWRIASRGMTFAFPLNTIVLRDASIRLSLAGLGFFASPDAALLYPNGDAAFSAKPLAGAPSAEITTALEEEPEPGGTASELVPEPSFSIESETEGLPDSSSPGASMPDEHSSDTSNDTDSEIDNTTLVAAAAGSSSGLSPMWWLGSLAVLGLSAFAIVSARRLRRRAPLPASRKTRVELKDWNIIEDGDETR